MAPKWTWNRPESDALLPVPSSEDIEHLPQSTEFKSFITYRPILVFCPNLFYLVVLALWGVDCYFTPNSTAKSDIALHPSPVCHYPYLSTIVGERYAYGVWNLSVGFLILFLLALWYELVRIRMLEDKLSDEPTILEIMNPMNHISFFDDQAAEIKCRYIFAPVILLFVGLSCLAFAVASVVTSNMVEEVHHWAAVSACGLMAIAQILDGILWPTCFKALWTATFITVSAMSALIDPFYIVGHTGTWYFFVLEHASAIFGVGYIATCYSECVRAQQGYVTLQSI